MLQTAIRHTLNQIFDPRFRMVLLTSLLLSLCALIATGAGFYYLWPQNWTTGWAWLDGIGYSAAMLLISYFVFPGLATLFVALQVDRIVDAVEDRYYPDHRASRDISITDGMISALSLLGTAVLVNLLALVPYLLLMVLTSGLGTLLLAVLINGYLLGREYFETVALRHGQRKHVGPLRKGTRGDWLPAGWCIAALFLVPFINIIAPIAGVAVMTHIFHGLRAQQPASP